MSQKLQDIDALVAGIMLDQGLCESATYTPHGGGSTIACTVQIDRDIQIFGVDEMPVGAPRTLVTLFLSEVAAPDRFDTVTLTATGETFTLDGRVKADGSRSQWACA